MFDGESGHSLSAHLSNMLSNVGGYMNNIYNVPFGRTILITCCVCVLLLFSNGYLKEIKYLLLEPIV